MSPVIAVHRAGAIENPEHLFILLHGYGADGTDMIGLASILAPLMPKIAFSAPDAPGKTIFGGRQWFELQNISAEEVEKGARQASQDVQDFIKKEAERYNLTYDKIILGGFSQGGMMALHVGLNLTNKLAAIISLSGLLPPQTLDDITTKQNADFPPICLIHGDQDEVIPHIRLQEAYEVLTKRQIPTQMKLIPGMGHGISQEAVNFMLDCLEPILNHPKDN